MKLFPFHKPPTQRRRRGKKSHKWIDRAKNEAKNIASLDNLEEDIVIKAAILCTAGHYSFKLSDFKWSSLEDAAYVQNIIWAIEALQKRYPRYLQYAKWVAIKQGIDVIEGKHKRYRKEEEPDYTFTTPEAAPPPDMGRLMQEEWDRHFTRPYEARRRVRSKDKLARSLREFKQMVELVNKERNQSVDKPAKTIAVDIGKGTFVEMTPDEHAIWNILTKGQQPPGKPNTEKNGSSK